MHLCTSPSEESDLSVLYSSVFVQADTILIDPVGRETGLTDSS